MTPHSVHLHVKRLTLDAALDRAVLVESIRRSLEQRLQSSGSPGGDWTQCVANAVVDAVSRSTRTPAEGGR